jgi:hypothetical protein
VSGRSNAARRDAPPDRRCPTDPDRPLAIVAAAIAERAKDAVG